MTRFRGFRQLLMLIVLVLLPLQVFALEPGSSSPISIDELLNRQLQALDTSEMDGFLDQLAREYEGYLPELSFSSVMRTLRGQEGGFSIKNLFTAIMSVIFREVVGQTGLLMRLLVLSILCVILQHLHEALGGRVASVAYLVCYLVLMGFALHSFGLAMVMTRNALNTMVSFMHAIYPLMLTLLLSVGNVSSAAIFNPILTIFLNILTSLIANTAVPIIFFAGVLILVNNLSERLQVSRLAFLLRDVAAGVMGVLFMIFVGLTVAQGTAGAVADGVAFRTGKFAVKAFLPVVGNLIADSFETVASCTLLLNNVLSFIGAIGIFLLCALPAIKVIAMIAVYRVAAAVIQPLGNGPLVEVLNNVANILMYFFGALALCGVMLFVLVTVIVSSGNSALMLR